MPKVSVILPIYNVSQYLRECLDSVLSQTLTEMEIICVNDGSTDDSLEIIKEYAERDDRIVVITGSNGGYGRAMNKGLDAARGEYIGIVEPDDYIPTDMYENLYRIADKEQLDFVKADFYRFYRDESGEEHRIYEALDKTATYYRKLLNPSQNPNLMHLVMNTWSGIYKREFIEAHHIRHHETPGASFQDNGFYFQTFIYAQRAMFVDTAYYRNRRDNPNSSVKSKEKVYCMNIEYDFIRDILMNDPEIWERFKHMYWWCKFKNYTFTYQRIDSSYKKQYLIRMQQEFKRAFQLDEISQDSFDDYEWKRIQMMLKNRDSFYERLRSFKLVRKIMPYIPTKVKKAVLNYLAK